MEKLVANNYNVLRYLMTEDIYILSDDVNPYATVTAVEPPAITPTPVELPEVAVVVPEVTRLDFTYLGENNRYFLVLVNDPVSRHIDKLHLEMLMKIMSAKNLELRDLAILNLHHHPDVNFSQLKEFFSCSKVVLFGINPANVGLGAIGVNSPAESHNSKILATYSLAEMADNTDKKRQFWAVMKDF